MRRAGERRLMSTLASSNSLYARPPQKAAQTSSPPTKTAAQTPANTESVAIFVKKSPFMDRH
jgi:hypothetical protein